MESPYQTIGSCSETMLEFKGLKNKTVAVVGFNARPIACSLKRLGAKVIVSDYWGDSDLNRCCDDWLALLTPVPGKRQRHPLELPLPNALLSNLEVLMKKYSVHHVIVGSGFDDHSEALRDLHADGLLLGTPPNGMMRSRQRNRLQEIAAKCNINVPLSGNAESLGNAYEIAGEIGYPVLVRPQTSGGGSGIRLAVDERNLEGIIGDREGVVIQEFIPGLDFSVSAMATTNESMIISIQGQLIGMPSAGRNCDFAYCGNYLPFTLNNEVHQQLDTLIEKFSAEMRLLGSNGFDFVLASDSRIFLMEVNPRIQGTLELLEMAGNISITQAHYDASVNGILPSKVTFQSGVKLLVYARKNMFAPDLSRLSTTFDRTPKGVAIARGDPICTVIEIGSSLSESYTNATQKARLIQKG